MPQQLASFFFYYFFSVSADIYVTIPVRIFLQIVFMVFLSSDIIRDMHNLNLNFFFVKFLLTVHKSLYYSFICLIYEVNTCSVLSSNIIPLFIFAGWINNGKIIF